MIVQTKLLILAYCGTRQLQLYKCLLNMPIWRWIWHFKCVAHLYQFNTKFINRYCCLFYWKDHGWNLSHFFFFLIWNLISLRISGLDNLASVRLPTVVEGLQRRKQSKRRSEMTGQTLSDEKVSMEFQMFWRFLFKRFLTLFGSDRSFI